MQNQKLYGNVKTQLREVSMNNDIKQARIDLAAAYRLANIHGLSEGICNHLTLLVPGHSDAYLVIAHGTHWSQVKASELLIVDTNGKVIEGKGKIEKTAHYIHAQVHTMRPELRCVMHTHQPHSLAIAMTEKGKILPASQNALRYYKRIAYDNNYEGLALNSSEGQRLVNVLDNKDILFMANHGVLVCGTTVAKTYDDLYYLERAAKAQNIAMSTGKKLKLISEQIATRAIKQFCNENSYAEDHFCALKKVLDETQPDYME